MSQLSPEKRFQVGSTVSVPGVGSDTDGLLATVSVDGERVRIKDHRYDHALLLDTFEACALRDWLNEVLPQ